MPTLGCSLTNVKDKYEPEGRLGAVHKTKCSECHATYMAETGRNLTTRLNERKQATKRVELNNNIAENHLKINHTLDWDSATYVAISITLERWFTTLR